MTLGHSARSHPPCGPASPVWHLRARLQESGVQRGRFLLSFFSSASFSNIHLPPYSQHHGPPCTVALGRRKEFVCHVNLPAPSVQPQIEVSQSRALSSGHL